MKRFRTCKSMILIAAIVFLLSIVACEKNPSEPKETEAPQLPPIESMKLDISFFNSSLGKVDLDKPALTKNNFANAAIRVLFINTVVTIAAFVPTAIFVAAISQEPVLKEDGKFHWIYSVENNNITFSVDLAGWVDMESSEVVWEVYVTSTAHIPPLDHFLWYTGRSKINNKTGWWLFYDDKSPESLIEVLKVDWAIPDVNQRELVFSNIEQASADYGDSLKYVVDHENDYLIFYDASNDRTNTIYWNSETGAGYIEWFDYKDGVRSYWDENQNDI